MLVQRGILKFFGHVWWGNDSFPVLEAKGRFPSRKVVSLGRLWSVRVASEIVFVEGSSRTSLVSAKRLVTSIEDRYNSIYRLVVLTKVYGHSCHGLIKSRLLVVRCMRRDDQKEVAYTYWWLKPVFPNQMTTTALSRMKHRRKLEDTINIIFYVCDPSRP